MLAGGDSNAGGNARGNSGNDATGSETDGECHAGSSKSDWLIK